MNPFEEIYSAFSQPNPSFLPQNLITSQSENSILSGLSDNFSAIDSSENQYSPSLPMQYSHHGGDHQAHHENFNLINNFSTPNHQNQAPTFLPFPFDSPLALKNSLLEVPYLNVQLKDSQIITSSPMECDNNGLNDNTFEGNQISDNGIDETNECDEEESNAEAQSKGRCKKTKSTFGERSSMYRGVSKYTGRYEAFLWDNTDPTVKSKTVYVGGFEREADAARAYDLAALKFWGQSAPLNFPLSDYAKEWEEMQNMTKKEYLLAIRRSSKGFAKGISNYRGVTRNSDNRRWQARLGKGKGIKGIYLGTFDSEVEAARAYDVAVIRMKGMKAVTNFDLNHYDIQSILESSKLPIGKGASKLLKKASVNDLLQKKKNNGKHPILQLHILDSSDTCSNASPQLQYSLEQIPNHHNNNKTNSFSILNPEIRNYFNPSNGNVPNFGIGLQNDGVYEIPGKNYTDHGLKRDVNQQIQPIPETEGFQFYGNQPQYQNPKIPPVFSVYQNPCFQTNQTSFLQLLNGVGGNGPISNVANLSGNINGGSSMSQAYPSSLHDGLAFNVQNGIQSSENLPNSVVFNGGSGMMGTNENSIADKSKDAPINGGQLGLEGSYKLDPDILPSWLEIFLKNSGPSASNA